jgi:hypothetical protein
MGSKHTNFILEKWLLVPWNGQISHEYNILVTSALWMTSNQDNSGVCYLGNVLFFSSLMKITVPVWTA